jgi:predicted NUDIX family NTP pyrophosphohydrolase
MFAMEWPPKSGRQADFPEVDRGDFFPIELAKQKVKPAQRPLIEELAAALSFPLKRDY